MIRLDSTRLLEGEREESSDSLQQNHNVCSVWLLLVKLDPQIEQLWHSFLW